MKAKILAVSVIAAIVLASGIALAGSQMSNGISMNDHHEQMHGENSEIGMMSGMHGMMNDMSLEEMQHMHNSMHGEELTEEEFAEHHASHGAGCSMMNK